MMLDLCLPESWGHEEGALARANAAAGQRASRSAFVLGLGTTLVKTNGVFYGVPGPVKTNLVLRRLKVGQMH